MFIGFLDYSSATDYSGGKGPIDIEMIIRRWKTYNNRPEAF